ncbi:TonB-dependent receptor plug domain-containing protein [Bacteroidota bacterium]
MHRLFLLIIIPLNALFCSGQVIHDIKEVVIEGKKAEDALEEQKKAGPSTLVISSKDMNNLGHNTAGDVLKRLPRMVIDGPPSFYRNVMMAGLDKEFQSVLINGNRPGGGEDYRDFKLDRLPVEMIEKIEIIYNPPASLGADATIGAVDISLKDTPEKQFVSADLSFDNTSTSRGINPELNLSYGNKWKKWSVFGNLNHSRFKRRNLAYLQDTALAGMETEDLNVKISGVTGTIAFEPDSVNRWKLQSFYTNYREDLDFLADVNRRSRGGLTDRADSAIDRKNRILHSHTLGYTRKKNNSSWHSGLTLAQHFDMKDKQRFREKTDYMEHSYEDEYQRNTDVIFKSEYSHKAGGPAYLNELKTGIRLSTLHRVYDRLVYTKDLSHMFWDEIEDGSYTLTEYRAGGFVADEFSIGKFWLSPAVRVDIDRGSYTTVTDSSGSMQYFSFNPSLHTKYHLSESFFLKADIARQIARPPFNAMVPVDKIKNKKKIIERGNPELIPSRAWNLGIGTEKYFSRNAFATIRGFYSVLSNVIEMQEIGIENNYGYRIYQSVNVDSGKIWGLDLSTRFDLLNTSSNNIKFWGNISWLGSEVRDPGTGRLRRLNLQPEWIINGSLDYLNTRLKIQCSIGWNYISERITASTIDEGSIITDLRQSPFTQWDARIKYFFSSWGSVYINGINLFNETFEFSQGVLTESHIIGRNIVLGISINY